MPGLGKLHISKDPAFLMTKVGYDVYLNYAVSEEMILSAYSPKAVLAHIAKDMAKAIENDIFKQLLASSLVPVVHQGSWYHPDTDVMGDIKKYAQAVFSSADHQAEGVLATLCKVVPGLKTARAKCPANKKCGEGPYKDKLVSSLIQHLNDHHRWTRERIADWLETLDVDLSFQEPQDPGTCQKCRYQAEGKWAGAKSISHNTDCPKYEGMKGYTPSFVIEDEAAEFASNHALDEMKFALMTAPLLSPEDAAKIINPS